MNSIEKLLEPRYKVIADYPKSIHSVGDVINAALHGGLLYCDTNGPKMADYPHLFKKLEWWEERSKEELLTVKYVRPTTKNGTLLKVADPSENFRTWHIDGEVEFRFLTTGRYIPVTEEEYNLSHPIEKP